MITQPLEDAPTEIEEAAEPAEAAAPMMPPTPYNIPIVVNFQIGIRYQKPNRPLINRAERRRLETMLLDAARKEIKIHIAKYYDHDAKPIKVEA